MSYSEEQEDLIGSVSVIKSTDKSYLEVGEVNGAFNEEKLKEHIKSTDTKTCAHN